MNNQNSNIKEEKPNKAEIKERMEIAKSLFGSVPDILTLEELKSNLSSVDSISGVLAGKTSPNLDRHYLREERLFKYTIDEDAF